MANVAKTESGRKGISAENKYGYLGKYQFGAEALADQGMVDKDKLKAAKAQYGKGWYAGGQTAFLNDASNWKIQGGKAAFMSDEGLQDQAMSQFTAKNINAGFKSGALNDQSTPEQIAGYAKAAHLKGTGGANNYFLRGIDSADANGTKVSTYAAQAAAAVNGGVPPSTPIATAPTTQAAFSVATAIPTTQSTAGTGNALDELKRQTGLLATIAQNTSQSYKPPSPDKRSNKESPAVVANQS
jgi:hypothetical protein